MPQGCRLQGRAGTPPEKQKHPDHIATQITPGFSNNPLPRGSSRESRVRVVGEGCRGWAPTGRSSEKDAPLQQVEEDDH